MTTVRENWGMACPACGSDDDLSVTAFVDCKLFPDGTEAEGGHEWEGKSSCRCADCGWDGMVVEATNTVNAENDLPDNCQIVRHGDGWRYFFEGDDDDDPLTFPTYLEAVEAANRIG